MLMMDENSFPRIRDRNAVSYRAAVSFDVSGILAVCIFLLRCLPHISSSISFFFLFTFVRPLCHPLLLYLDDI